MTYEDIWRDLEASPGGGAGGCLARRVRPESVCDIRLAIEKPSNTRLLLLRVAAPVLKPAGQFPRSLGFEVRRLFQSVDGKKHVHLAIRLSHPRFADVFTSLAEDVVGHVARASDDLTAVRTLIHRLERWQAFLKQHAVDGLSEESRQGLYGELWFLGRHVIPRFGPRPAVSSWKGPGGAPQDFQLPGLAVEVKTSTGRQHQKLTISNERQLNATGVGQLLLFHLSLDARQGGGETLPARVALTRELVAADAIAVEEFEEVLFTAGYLDCHAPAYEGLGYTVRESNFFEVRDQFPRIVEADLRKGVGDVCYSVSVAECKNYLLPESRVNQLFGAPAHGY
jgi:hypothetical protein